MGRLLNATGRATEGGFAYSAKGALRVTLRAADQRWLSVEGDLLSVATFGGQAPRVGLPP
jgi:hypothetical protein